jgi:Flp pilus assembly protein TadG
MKRRITNEAGMSTTVEIVMAAPVLVLFVMVIVFGGRVAVAHQAVQSAAADAARSASISRTGGEARTDASKAAAANLANVHQNCSTMTVAVNTGQFSRPVGTAASVSATVTCHLLIADLGLPGMPGTFTVDATVASPLDTYRERG